MPIKALLCLGAAMGPGATLAQDEHQRSTSHWSAYDELDQLVTRTTRLEEEGRYLEALDIYEEALARQPHSVVPIDRSRALGVREYVLARIGAWPEEGKAVYRRHADPAAERAFTAAKAHRDVAALERLIEEYPYSSTVDDAIDLMANLWLDEGQYDRAAGALVRLLTLWGDVSRPVTFARLGMAYARGGQKGLLGGLVDRAAREHPEATLRVGGRLEKLVDHLRALHRDAREERVSGPPMSIPGWEMLGGGPPGWRLADGGVEPGPLAWRAPLNLPPQILEEDSGFGRSYVRLPPPDSLPFFPAVSDGIVYVHDETLVTAYNLYARRPERLWEYRAPWPGGEFMFDDRVIYATTVHQGRVYANLLTGIESAEDQLQFVRVKFPFSRRALFALDAYTGHPLWKLGGQVQADEFRENITFSVPPTPEGDRLYVGAIQQKFNTDPFQHYVLCLDAATGRILWSTFVASGGTEINLFGNSTRESLGSPVCVGPDSVFYVTHHGVAAALEKHTGRLRWAFQYEQLRLQPTRSVRVSKNPLGWINSPPATAHGVVVFTPMDSPKIYALDARTGDVLWEDLRDRELLRVLHGIRDNTVILGGLRLQFRDLRTGERTFQSGPDLMGTGRGVAAEDGVYVACSDRLRRVRWDGTIEDLEVPGWRSSGVGGGGNLLVVDGMAILAGRDALQVYFDPRRQEEAIIAGLEKNPADPVVLYRGALRLLQSGSADLAEKLLARAVARAERSVRPQDGRFLLAARRRLFSVRMEAGHAELEAKRLDKAEGIFASAREAAPDARCRVEASLALGRARADGGDHPGALGEYQRLIVEEGVQKVEGVSVFELAREAIGSILERHGRDSYAPYEHAAARLLEGARRAGTPDAYEKVARSYPNSRAAEEAVYESAAANRRLGRDDEEIRILRAFLREYDASSRSPEAHAALVLALERKGHHVSAGAWLRRMLRSFPEAEIDEGGVRVKVRDFAERRLGMKTYTSPQVGPGLPGLAPPLRKEKELELEDRDPSVVVPLAVAGVPPQGAGHLAFVAQGSTVKALDLVRGGPPAWSLGAPSTVLYAAFVDGAMVVAGERGVIRVNLRDGKEEWRYVSGMPLRGFVTAREFLCFITAEPRGGEMVQALDLSRGRPAWSRDFDGTAASRIHFTGESVVFLSVAPCRLHRFEVETGRRLLGRAEYTRDNTARIVHASEGILILHSERRFVEAYDLSTGALKWRLGLRNFGTREEPRMGPEGLVILGTLRSGDPREEPAFMAVVDVENGKILRMQEKLDAGDVRFWGMDGALAYVVSKEAAGPAEGERALVVRGIRLKDFTVAWRTELGGRAATLLPPRLACEHLVVAACEADADGKYGYSAWLLDRSGQVVQNIRSSAVFERPPTYDLAGGRILFCADHRVEVYR